MPIIRDSNFRLLLFYTFLKNFSQNFVKTALCGVVGNERDSRVVGILPNKPNLSGKP